MIVALIGGAHAELGARLTAALRHPWIATYAVGFGPPLIGANPALRERLATATGALSKLEAYADTCLVPQKERVRLAWIHRLRLRTDDRREASRRSTEALDLTLRLHHPSTAPARVAPELAAAGREFPAPELLDARLLVRLDDPLGASLGARLDVPEEVLVLELVVDLAAAEVWRAWGDRLPGTRAILTADERVRSTELPSA